MISSQPAIPLLVHEDCMGDIKTGLTDQQATLSKIESNTANTVTRLNDIEKGILLNINEDTMAIERNTSSIKTSSSNTATATSSLNSAVGTTTDASTSNTVIGLLKSISNKL